MRRIATFVAALTVAGLLAGCVAGVSTQQVPTTAPSIRGVITSADPAGGQVASIRVVWTADPAVGARTDLDAAQLGITETTVIRRRLGGAYETLTRAELKVGAIVEVWITGPVAESYPVQASAATVVVTGTFTGALPVPQGLQPDPVPAP
jgi:hypothetical protein